MPDADGKLRGISVPAEAWERVFGPGMHAHDHDWGQNRTTDDAVPSRALGQNPPANENNQVWVRDSRFDDEFNEKMMRLFPGAPDA